jgi:uncharacterized coiled-coil protein SlyX
MFGMGDNEKFSQEVELFEKARKKFDEVCKTLEAYERRVQLQSMAIKELQDIAVMDGNKIDRLLRKVEQLEQKLKADVMYQ